MNKLKKVLLGVFAFFVMLGISGYVDITRNASAANSLLGNNEVITIKTTDSLPVNNTVSPLAYSADGNVVLFSSSATNLPNANSFAGLYTYNLSTDTTMRIDISTNGTLPNGVPFGGWTSYPLSETGRYVSFASYATNLIDGTTQATRSIYKRDTQTNTTTLIASASNSPLSQNWDRNLGISNDGRFSMIASRYTGGNTYPNYYRVLIGEDTNGTYSWTSLASGGGSPGNTNDGMVVGGSSCDGSIVVYQSAHTIKLADVRRGSVQTISISGYMSTSPIISCNGIYILYATENRADVDPTLTGYNNRSHLVRYNRITGQRQYVDSSSSGTLGNGMDYSTMNEAYFNIFNASIANTGDVVFNYNNNIHLKHLSDGSGTLESIGKTATGTYLNISNGAITADGRYIFFQADPYSLGIGSSPAGNQIIRTKTNL